MSDGDSLRTTAGKKVRLLQIDAPELHGDCFGKAALSALRQLTPKGTPVTLVRDPGLDQTDRYGRLLRYVIVHGTNVNVALVRGGTASPYFFRNERGRYAGAAPCRRGEGPSREARLLGRLPQGEAEHRPRLDHRARLSERRVTGASRHSAPIG